MSAFGFALLSSSIQRIPKAGCIRPPSSILRRLVCCRLPIRKKENRQREMLSDGRSVLLLLENARECGNEHAIINVCLVVVIVAFVETDVLDDFDVTLRQEPSQERSIERDLPRCCFDWLVPMQLGEAKHNKGSGANAVHQILSHTPSLSEHVAARAPRPLARTNTSRDGNKG